ncbi:MAG: chemotaxis protein CheA, partial [Serpentinimonas sp.]|nr:chemotaxis protein CheA [Serpentinimonas sp.]
MPAASAAGVERSLQARIGPLSDTAQADPIKDLFRDIVGLGHITAERDEGGCRIYDIHTTSSDAELLDLFAFHVAKDAIRLQAASPAAAAPDTPSDVIEQGYGLFAGAPGSPVPGSSVTASGTVVPEPDLVQGYGLFAGAPGNRVTPQSHAQELLHEGPNTGAAATEPGSKPAEAAKSTRPVAAAAAAAQPEATTLRVSVSKIDQLINQVGELVITQAMLAQNSRALDSTLNQQLLAGLADLERNTRDLQESIMSIRMIPMSVVFSRFQRMLRDLASKLGKKVELVTQGEATEL